MEARFIHDGKALDFIPATDIPAGSVVVQNDLVCVTKSDIMAGHLGAVHVSGVYDVAKGATEIPLGSKVYWDDVAKQATITAGTNKLFGISVREAMATDSVVRVLLL
jgi:predicted RecA/RadA family phage recombinase